jgi:hypothetical protein
MQGPKVRNGKAKPSRVLAITRSLPPQSGQVSISMENTRLSRCAQLIGASGLSLSKRPLVAVHHPAPLSGGIFYCPSEIYPEFGITPFPEVPIVSGD